MLLLFGEKKLRSIAFIVMTENHTYNGDICTITIVFALINCY